MWALEPAYRPPRADPRLRTTSQQSPAQPPAAAERSDASLRQLQAGQRGAAGAKSLALQAESLQQRQIQIAKRDTTPRLVRIFFVLAVLEPAAGENDRQIGVDVRVGVAHAAA